MARKEILEAIRKRASVRAYDKSKEVSKEQIEAILEAARLAPSARNTQPWAFYVAESDEAKAKVMKAMSEHNAWANEASVLLVVCADLRNVYRLEEKKYYVDIGLCLENILLEIVNQGLAACPCAAFDKERLARVLQLPEHLEPLIIVSVGYEAKGKLLQQLREKYGNVVERKAHKLGGTKSLEEVIFKWE
ncbi:MAG: nitroreductase family protein [Candidatus Diapherotrites archaeon]|nr:nitroreductase family protein [Candidatus Diapherotrites archaeon]